MDIRKILVTGRLYKQLERIMPEKAKELEFRFLADVEITMDDMDWADAFVGFRPSPVFEADRLKWVHALGAGVDAFLYGASGQWDSRVILTRTNHCFGVMIGEYCLSYILRYSQRHKEYASLQRQKSWNAEQAPLALRGQRVIVFGTGSIGSEVARICSSLGMVTYGVSRSGRLKEHFAGITALQHCSKFLKQADWVVNTLPLTKDTQGIFGREMFEQMAGASFINVGRGATVDDGALVEALNKDHIGLAVLDVFPEEPLPKQSPFWDREDVIITPHISGVTSPEEAAASFLDTWRILSCGGEPMNRATPELGY